jgi:hypothetical protein
MTPEELRAALACALKKAERAEELAEWYSGNNPGKQARLDLYARMAKREVERLEALIKTTGVG